MLMPELDWSRNSIKKKGYPKTGPGLRRYRPGIAAGVQLTDDGKPTLIQSSVISGKILEARGPWKLSGSWWDRTRWETKEWDIALDNGGIYRIAQRTTLQDQWEVVGVYD
jgi:protein ImuB